MPNTSNESPLTYRGREAIRVPIGDGSASDYYDVKTGWLINPCGGDLIVPIGRTKTVEESVLEFEALCAV